MLFGFLLELGFPEVALVGPVGGCCLGGGRGGQEEGRRRAGGGQVRTGARRLHGLFSACYFTADAEGP